MTIPQFDPSIFKQKRSFSILIHGNAPDHVIDTLLKQVHYTKLVRIKETDEDLDTTLKELIDEQRKAKNVCCVVYEGRYDHQAKYLKHLVLNTKSLNCILILHLEPHSKVSPIIRTNADFYMLFEGTPEWCYEYTNYMENFKEILNKVTAIPNTCMVMDLLSRSSRFDNILSQWNV